MLEALFIIWLILVFILWAGTVLFAGFTIWEYENPLKHRRAFLVSAFYWQYAIWKSTKETINIAGEIVLQLLISPLATPISLLMLAWLFIGEVCRFFVRAFIAVFRKKPPESK